MLPALILALHNDTGITFKLNSPNNNEPNYPGELFHQHPDAIYWYEPLAAMYTKKYYNTIIYPLYIFYEAKRTTPDKQDGDVSTAMVVSRRIWLNVFTVPIMTIIAHALSLHFMLKC